MYPVFPFATYSHYLGTCGCSQHQSSMGTGGALYPSKQASWPIDPDLFYKKQICAPELQSVVHSNPNIKCNKSKVQCKTLVTPVF